MSKNFLIFFFLSISLIFIFLILPSIVFGYEYTRDPRGSLIFSPVTLNLNNVDWYEFPDCDWQSNGDSWLFRALCDNPPEIYKSDCVEGFASDTAEQIEILEGQNCLLIGMVCFASSETHCEEGQELGAFILEVQVPTLFQVTTTQAVILGDTFFAFFLSIEDYFYIFISFFVLGIILISVIKYFQ